MFTVILTALLWWGVTADDFNSESLRQRFYGRVYEVLQDVKDVPEAFRK